MHQKRRISITLFRVSPWKYGTNMYWKPCWCDLIDSFHVKQCNSKNYPYDCRIGFWRNRSVFWHCLSLCQVYGTQANTKNRASNRRVGRIRYLGLYYLQLKARVRQKLDLNQMARMVRESCENVRIGN